MTHYKQITLAFLALMFLSNPITLLSQETRQPTADREQMAEDLREQLERTIKAQADRIKRIEGLLENCEDARAAELLSLARENSSNARAFLSEGNIQGARTSLERTKEIVQNLRTTVADSDCISRDDDVQNSKAVRTIKAMQKKLKRAAGLVAECDNQAAQELIASAQEQMAKAIEAARAERVEAAKALLRNVNQKIKKAVALCKERTNDDRSARAKIEKLKNKLERAQKVISDKDCDRGSRLLAKAKEHFRTGVAGLKDGRQEGALAQLRVTNKLIDQAISACRREVAKDRSTDTQERESE